MRPKSNKRNKRAVSPPAVYLEPRAQFDAAITKHDKHERPVYSYSRIIKVLTAMNDWTIEEAYEYADYNIDGLTCNGLILRHDD